MEGLARRVVAHPRTIVILWAVVLAVAAPMALRLAHVAQGGSEAIRGSESHAVMSILHREFGAGSALTIPVVLTSEHMSADNPAFAATVTDLSARLSAHPHVR